MAKILIVDDSRTSRKMLRNILESNGHEIIDEAVNGQEGVQKFQALKPDVVTLDITMPVVDGVEALKMIKALDPESKVVMVTAAGQKNKMIECIKAGANEFLTKPFEQQEIVDVINKMSN
ncbi:MAG: response regulator [Lachnospiraceae bacterium]|jgi:two-component system chemotaxis response regulator CheY|nr:response regulator [Bacillota bacterium]MDY3769307.1 response regulator [Lachnospiraceae bacterium]OLA28480.1 MAG: two-component system response regulator [Firmicutes bacterium CAG_194_44_15]CCZ28664.1 two-component system chemotaxis family response regulator CheY [Firmicutes bacterium CAG:194]MDD6695524.1 response regulator [Bacillota bacterium]